MARRTRDERLETRTARLKLPVRREPYWKGVQEARAIGYRRLGNGKSGTWVARYYDKTAVTPRQFLALGSADDYLDADGIDTLSFSQALDRANEFFVSCLRARGVRRERITVREAADHYMRAYRAKGKKAETETQTTIDAHILPTFGSIFIDDLTTLAITQWRDQLATAPARLRSGPKTKIRKVRKAVGADAKRARRATANRILTVFKAILNLVFTDGLVDSDDAWRRVKSFQNADAPKIRYLTDEEARTLVSSCYEDFRNLVTAALLTGCRYGELTNLRVKDLDLHAAVAHVREGKSGKPRVAFLTEEGVELLGQLATGLSGDAFVLPRADGLKWGKGHQARRMAEACGEANINPTITFHILRHTFASRLAMRGVEMSVIAAAIGDSEITCAAHYAHLSPRYTADRLRTGFGRMDILPKTDA